jgi:Crinkler effector protein N-terminal domain
VRGAPSNTTFEVEIGKGRPVMVLRDDIRKKSRDTFYDIDADPLLLFKVLVPLNESLKDDVEKILPVTEVLSPVDILSDVFLSTPPANHVHIVLVPSSPPSRAQQHLLINLPAEEGAFPISNV